MFRRRLERDITVCKEVFFLYVNLIRELNVFDFWFFKRL